MAPTVPKRHGGGDGALSSKGQADRSDGPEMLPVMLAWASCPSETELYGRLTIDSRKPTMVLTQCSVWWDMDGTGRDGMQRNEE
jgi:hypothetical protein